jgi:hypothetical protein
MVVLDCLMLTFSPSSSLVTANGSTLGLAISHWCTLCFGSSVLWWGSSEEDELQTIIESLPSSKLASVVLKTTVFPLTDGIDFDFCWTSAQLLRKLSVNTIWINQC